MYLCNITTFEKSDYEQQTSDESKSSSSHESDSDESSSSSESDGFEEGSSSSEVQSKQEDELLSKTDPHLKSTLDSITNSIALLETKKAELLLEAQKVKQSMTQAVLQNSDSHCHHDCGCVPPKTVLIKPELHPDSIASVLTPISHYMVDSQRLSGNQYTEQPTH